MSEYIVKRHSNNPLVVGSVLFALCFVFSLLYWPIWGSIAKSIALSLSGPLLASIEPTLAAKYIGVFTEGTFFWLIITPWIWQALIFGNYGKYHLTQKQPHAGIWYLLVGCISGIIGFFVLVSFIGIWWKPFSLAVLFTPASAHEVHLAIEGWETGNFFALASIMVQILYVAAFHKWPFAGKIQAPWDGFGSMMTSLAFCLICWIAMFFPSFMQLQLGGQVIVSAPFGSWPEFLAFAQAFILIFLMPTEGGELYPTKLLAPKQPWFGLVGTAIAIAAGFILPKIYAALLAPMNLMPGAPMALIVTIVELATICMLLTWHHLFDDYPSSALVPGTGKRVLIKHAIWLIGGFICGVIWLKVFKMLPFAGSDLGMGFPVMGPVAGQFALLMIILFCNTYFDKWPMVYKEEVKTPSKPSGQG